MRNALMFLMLSGLWLFPAAVPALETASPRGVEAKFTQTRQIAELDMTMTFRGFMRCEPGKRLKWAVCEPVQSVTLMEADKLTNLDVKNGKKVEISADKIPMLELLNSNLSAWMTGDTAVLQKNFSITRSGERELRLIPAGMLGRAWLKKVEITFDNTGKTVEKVRVTEASGGITEIVFHAVRLNPDWKPSDWELDLK